MGVKAVLLDVDGTLIDSNDAHAQAWVDVGEEFGYEIAFDHVRSLIGMGGDRVLPRVTGLEEESKDGEKILERRGEIFREKYLPSLMAFPETRELLQRLLDEGKTLVIATSASEKDLKALLKQGGFADLIDDSTNSDEAEDSKPAPDIVDAALKKAGTAADETVMLGDTPYDVKAATRAGVRCIAVRCGGWRDDDLEGAVEIYDAPADILTHYEASVLSR